MKKLIIVAPGAETLVNFRENLIKEIKKKNYKIKTISQVPSKQYSTLLKKKKIENISLNFKNNSFNILQDIISFIKLYKIIKKEKPEIILAYSIKPIIWCGIITNIYKNNFYALITGLGYSFQGTSIKRKILKKFVIFLYKIALKKSKAVIFQNKDNLNYFINHRIIPKFKSNLVNGSGVDTLKFKLKKFPKKKIKFLCVSRILHEKGLREYASAAKIVKKKYPHVQFDLLGAIDTSNDAISLKEVKSWSNYINYISPKIDVRPFIKNTHIFILPSYHEGIPKSTLEAMAMGRPILTTNAVGCKETVKNYFNGFKVPVRSVDKLVEKIIWFIKNPKQVQKMGIHSRRLALDKFNVKKINLKILKIMRLNFKK